MNSTSGEMKPFAYHVAIFICVLVQSVLVDAGNSCQNVTLNSSDTVTEGLFIPKNYNKKERPNSSETTNVQVKFTLQQITSINDQDFTISLDMFLSLYWKDPRLKYVGDDLNIQTHTNRSSYMRLSKEWAEKLWLPDIYVRKMKYIKEPKLLQEFGGTGTYTEMGQQCCPGTVTLPYSS